MSYLSTTARLKVSIFLFVFLSFGNASIWAQSEPRLDSLLNNLDDLIFTDPSLAKSIIDSLNQGGELAEHKEYQHSLGNYYYLSGHFDSAFTAYSNALVLAEADGDSSRVLSLNNNIGVSLIEMGRISESIAYLKETLEQRKALGDTQRVLSGYGNLIEAYQVLEAKDKIAELLKESFEYKVDSISYAEGLRRLHLLAYFHFYKQEDYSKALLHLEGMRRLNTYLDDLRSLGEYHLGKGRVLAALGENNKASYHLKQAIQRFEQTKYFGGLTAAFLEMAQFEEKRNPLLALKYYQDALKNVSAPDIEMSIYAGLFNLYKKEGQFKKAIEAQEKIAILKDSLQGVAVQKAVFEIESKYQLREKESEIRRLNDEAIIAQLKAEQAESKAKRLAYYLAAGLGVLVLTILLFSLQMRNQALKRLQLDLKRDLDEQTLKIEKQQLQIQLFRSQINPHFFFNTLNSIQSYVLENNPLESSRYLGKFARLMRATLELNQKEFISLEQEVTILQDYLSLEKLRFEDKFTWKLDLPPAMREFYIPSMILQPFVENAIVHGLRDINDNGLIELCFTESEESIQIEILDNGRGYYPSPIKNKEGQSSMALQLIKKRLELLSAESKGVYTFTIRNREHQSGTQVKLNIPKQ
jgi:tetratricopeptide (TPR) repeat protein